mmetsp:Transcript_19294/g.56619  ORF Transcript_19294/g.56619 Transcript_19294/m.56619 type:complete len:228 (-) Transcript_19294:746-1429(-)
MARSAIEVGAALASADRDGRVGPDVAAAVTSGLVGGALQPLRAVHLALRSRGTSMGRSRGEIARADHATRAYRGAAAGRAVVSGQRVDGDQPGRRGLEVPSTQHHGNLLYLESSTGGDAGDGLTKIDRRNGAVPPPDHRALHLGAGVCREGGPIRPRRRGGRRWRRPMRQRASSIAPSPGASGRPCARRRRVGRLLRSGATTCRTSSRSCSSSSALGASRGSGMPSS